MKQLVCVTLLALSAITVNGESCVTPDGSKGNCVIVLSCPVLASIVHNNDRSPEQIALLKNSGCGFEESIPKVCCPKACVTQEGEQGSCVTRSSCTHLSKNVEAKSCIGSDSICCPRQNGGAAKGGCEKIALSAFPYPKDSYCCGTDSVTDIKFSYAGGQNATAINQYPWLALIDYQDANKTTIKPLCGGSLISGKYVLTAAHCISGAILKKYTPIGVRLGEYDTTTDEDCVKTEFGIECAAPTVTLPVESYIAHPDFDPRTIQNDIALIRLKYLAPYTDFIKPICLPTKDYSLQNLPVFNLFVAGWGSASYRSSVKQDVQLKFVEIKDCQTFFNKSGSSVKLGSGQVCAGGEVGKNACRGNSGGPLMYNKGSTFEAIGVTSFGARCHMEDVPTVFTNVYKYIDWIYSVIEA